MRVGVEEEPLKSGLHEMAVMIDMVLAACSRKHACASSRTTPKLNPDENPTCLQSVTQPHAAHPARCPGRARLLMCTLHMSCLPHAEPQPGVCVCARARVCVNRTACVVAAVVALVLMSLVVFGVHVLGCPRVCVLHACVVLRAACEQLYLCWWC